MRQHLAKEFCFGGDFDVVNNWHAPQKHPLWTIPDGFSWPFSHTHTLGYQRVRRIGSQTVNLNGNDLETVRSQKLIHAHTHTCLKVYGGFLSHGGTS